MAWALSRSRRSLRAFAQFTAACPFFHLIIGTLLNMRECPRGF